jgi:hypothetical protein
MLFAPVLTSGVIDLEGTTFALDAGVETLAALGCAIGPHPLRAPELVATGVGAGEAGFGATRHAEPEPALDPNLLGFGGAGTVDATYVDKRGVGTRESSRRTT